MTIKADLFAPLAVEAELRTQYGALCWRDGKEGLEVLLITSRETGRWVIPKGWPIKNLPPEHSAAREAWEEAGVEGRADPHCLGLYSYDKALGKLPGPRASVPCLVAVYPLKVDALANRFPEAGQRKRKWFSPRKAARKVAEPELQALLAHLPRHLAEPPTAA
ncbi:8-oxo-dGTP pyrophosphatase MutT, NUDIX family [Gemmobacter aquatilis]|uniref:8-oxo-dGTP pyrophosphatase MutT, NUDIX family n=1 Tax=Gemmobacter aquatilis TaxID=933059 RepID=A0A1H8DI77_9RHOB|nr:NUDIX hydrolase [Gemmobacter aquatilis]SEN07031.1 8-oxo-dGTP pyrophosphatase MutT, NUDIX family [Gemmobacter aquatilis]